MRLSLVRTRRGRLRFSRDAARELAVPADWGREGATPTPTSPLEMLTLRGRFSNTCHLKVFLHQLFQKLQLFHVLIDGQAFF